MRYLKSLGRFALPLIFALGLFFSEAQAQFGPSPHLLRSAARYAPYIEADRLIPTGAYDQYIYNGSDISVYGMAWSVSAFFNTSDGGLDHLVYWMILSLDPDDAYLSVLARLQATYAYKLIPAPETFKDVLLSVVSPGDSPERRMILMGMSKIVDVRFMVNDLSETELVKIIGRDDHANCWIAKFPLAVLSSSLRTAYSKAVSVPSKLKDKKKQNESF